MSLLHIENFSNYGSSIANLLATGVFSNVDGSLVNDPDGVSSGKVLKIVGGDSGQQTRGVIPTAGDVHNLGFRWWLSQLPNSNAHSPSVLLKDASNNSKYQLKTSPTGSLILVRSTDGTTVDQTGGPVIAAGAWFHIEWYMNRTSGDYEVRVEGVTVLSGTDASPATGDSGIFEFRNSSAGSGASNTTPYAKDFFIADDAGSVNDSFIGPVKIYTLLVDGDVSNGWDLSSGTSVYPLLAKTTPNDASYIQADDTPPAAAILTLQDLPSDVVAVRAVQTMVRALKTDGGDADLQVSLLSSGDADAGATHAVGTSARVFPDISELDPHTAAAWSPVGVNAAEIKIDRTL